MITHSTVCRVMSRSVSIDGIATLTIATSRIVMKNAVPTTARISQRRGFGSAATSVKSSSLSVRWSGKTRYGRALFQLSSGKDSRPAQCRKCLRPVKTIVAPARSTAAITSASRFEPPGWMAAEDALEVPLARRAPATLAIDEDARCRLLLQRLERGLVVAGREQNLDELPDEQIGELLRNRAVQDHDASVRGSRVSGQRAFVRVLDRACDRDAARVRVLDDHAGGQLELAQAEPRRVQVVEVVVRELTPVQLLDLREQVPSGADLGVVGRALVWVLAVREIERLLERWDQPVGKRVSVHEPRRDRGLVGGGDRERLGGELAARFE